MPTKHDYNRLERMYESQSDLYEELKCNHEILQIALSDMESTDIETRERNAMLEGENEVLAVRCDELQAERNAASSELRDMKNQVFDRLSVSHTSSPDRIYALEREIECLKSELSRLERHSEALPMRTMELTHPSDTIMLQSQTIALPKQDEFQVESVRDPMTFENNVLGRCGDRTYRYATRALDTIPEPHVQKMIWDDLSKGMFQQFMQVSHGSHSAVIR